MKEDVVPGLAFTPDVTEGHNGATTAFGDAGGGRNSACRDVEKRGKDNVLAAVILIGGVPDCVIVFRLLNRPRKSLAPRTLPYRRSRARVITAFIRGLL